MMPAVSTKICGLSTAEALDAAIGSGAAHVGFVVFPNSPRHVDPERLAALAARVPDRVRRVGVFVDPDDELLTRAAPFLDVIQLHGRETADRVATVRARFGREIWRAVPVRTRADLAAAHQYRGAADRLLYDAKPPAGADLPGGLGLRFDWRLLDGFDHPLPWALSGGLDQANLAEAVAVTGARLVDVSSGVESAPGVKAVDKIAGFLQAAAQL